MKAQLMSDVQVKNFESVGKIVVLSDTHIPVRAAKIPQHIINEFNNAGLIVHAGDYQTLEIVQSLESYGNFIGVAGNADSDDIAEKLPEKVIIRIKNGDKEFSIGLMHGFGSRDGIAERVLNSFDEQLDCIIFGHSHLPLSEKISNTLMFNPGSATDTVFTQINTFGILKIGNQISGEIIKVRQ